MKSTITLLLSIFTLFSLVALPIFAHEEGLAVREIKALADETHHLEVKPESLEGYRLPYMKATVTIVDQETQEKNIVELHPMFGGNFHYGANIALKSKSYLLRFHLDPPIFARGHARENQWLQPVEAEFLFDASIKYDKSIILGSKEIQDMKISFEAEHAESMFILEGTEQEHGTGGHQAISTQTSSPIIFYVIFLVIGIVLGFVISLFLKIGARK